MGSFSSLVLGPSAAELAPIPWASRQAGAYVGQRATFDIGLGDAAGFGFKWNGTRWRLATREATIWAETAIITGVAQTAEQYFRQLTIAAGLLDADGDTLEIWPGFSKTGTTDAITLRMRFGAAGASGDNNLQGTASTMTGTNVQHGPFMRMRRASATTMRLSGSSGQIGMQAYSAVSTAGASPVTVADMSTTANILSIGVSSNGTTDVPALKDLYVRLIHAA